jgi:membrane protease YdiL (CAAX protease family)
VTDLAHRPEAVLLALLVAVVYPLIGLRRFRRIEHLPEPLPSRMRLRIYWSLLVSQWLLVTLTVLLFLGAGRSLADIGQSLGPRPGTTVLVAAVLLAAFAVLARFTTGQLRTAQLSDLPHRMRQAGKILPHTAEERAWFIAVALTAGVCEEILYRGFLPWFIDAHTGGFVGVGYVVAALVFGLGHAYQGKDGMVVTAILGLVFGLIAWFVRSLVPGQLLHVAIDLVNGIAVGATLARVRAQAQAAPELADIDAPAAPSA